MPVKDIFKVSRKTFFNPTAWFGDALAVNSKVTWDTTKDLFIPQEATRTETFAEAMQRLNLTEADLEERSHRFLLYAYLFLLCACLSVVYGFYLLFAVASYAGFVLSLAVTALFLAQAFRFHFWFFQIKFRKLGCTFKEWRQGRPNEQVP